MTNDEMIAQLTKQLKVREELESLLREVLATLELPANAHHSIAILNYRCMESWKRHLERITT